MTPDSSTHPHDDLAVYALDALEPEQRAAVDAHLAGCAACRAELDAHLATLGHMTVPEEPPDRLWESIASQIGPTAVAPAEEPQVVRLDERRRPRLRRLLVAAAVVTAGLGGAGVLVADLGGDDPSVSEAAEAAAADPDSTVVQLAGPQREPAGRVVVTDGEDYVVFDDLVMLDDEHTYQLWRTDAEAPVSLGLLGDATDGAARLDLPDDTTAFAVSREPAGGSSRPTEIVATEA